MALTSFTCNAAILDPHFFFLFKFRLTVVESPIVCRCAYPFAERWWWWWLWWLSPLFFLLEHLLFASLLREKAERSIVVHDLEVRQIDQAWAKVGTSKYKIPRIFLHRPPPPPTLPASCKSYVNAQLFVGIDTDILGQWVRGSIVHARALPFSAHEARLLFSK